jgi:hypothetical protein
LLDQPIMEVTEDTIRYDFFDEYGRPARPKVYKASEALKFTNLPMEPPLKLYDVSVVTSQCLRVHAF